MMPAGESSNPSLTAGLKHAFKRTHQKLRAFGNKLSRMRAQRKQRVWSVKLVAVTGSCGKTTATVLSAAALAGTGATVAVGKINNAGRYVLRTMAHLPGPADFVVQEVSGSEPGAIADLTDHLSVEVAVVTSIGYDHSTSFGTSYTDAPEAIALEKGRLVEAVASDGLVCLNFDDPRVAAMASRTRARVIGYGRGETADLRAINVSARWPERLHFDLVVDGNTYPVRTRYIGTIMLPSILAALAVAYGTGRDLRRAIDTLANTEPEYLRMSVTHGASGRTYVLDTEKAPMWSTEILAEDLANIGGGELLFVLGEMSDMRRGKTRHYVRIASQIASIASSVILTGQAASAEERIRTDGPANVQIASTVEELARTIAARPERLVILKAKEHSGLELIPDKVEALAAASQPQVAAPRHT